MFLDFLRSGGRVCWGAWSLEHQEGFSGSFDPGSAAGGLDGFRFEDIGGVEDLDLWLYEELHRKYHYLTDFSCDWYLEGESRSSHGVAGEAMGQSSVSQQGVRWIPVPWIEFSWSAPYSSLQEKTRLGNLALNLTLLLRENWKTVFSEESFGVDAFMHLDCKGNKESIIILSLFTRKKETATPCDPFFLVPMLFWCIPCTLKGAISKPRIARVAHSKRQTYITSISFQTGSDSHCHHFPLKCNIMQHSFRCQLSAAELIMQPRPLLLDWPKAPSPRCTGRSCDRGCPKEAWATADRRTMQNRGKETSPVCRFLFDLRESLGRDWWSQLLSWSYRRIYVFQQAPWPVFGPEIQYDASPVSSMNSERRAAGMLWRCARIVPHRRTNCKMQLGLWWATWSSCVVWHSLSRVNNFDWFIIFCSQILGLGCPAGVGQFLRHGFFLGAQSHPNPRRRRMVECHLDHGGIWLRNNPTSSAPQFLLFYQQPLGYRSFHSAALGRTFWCVPAALEGEKKDDGLGGMSDPSPREQRGLGQAEHCQPIRVINCKVQKGIYEMDM